MTIPSVVGARPRFVELAPVARPMAGRSEHTIVHMRQRCDDLVSDVFFRDLGIAAAHVELAVGSRTHGEQTGAVIAGPEPVFERHTPHLTLNKEPTSSPLSTAPVARTAPTGFAESSTHFQQWERLRSCWPNFACRLSPLHMPSSFPRVARNPSAHCRTRDSLRRSCRAATS